MGSGGSGGCGASARAACFWVLYSVRYSDKDIFRVLQWLCKVGGLPTKTLARNCSGDGGGRLIGGVSGGWL